jgi:pyrimidine operon attenuation protein/uracil phosphoribosyltransferase
MKTDLPPPPDPEKVLADLVGAVRRGIPDPAAWQLVAVANGGIALAARLRESLGASAPVGIVNALFHRDDISLQPILKDFQPTDLPFPVDDARILLIDDVFASGRTLRAALNELFDHGRPAEVRCAVLIDTGCRRLPLLPDFTGARYTPPPASRIQLAPRPGDGKLTLAIVPQ